MKNNFFANFILTICIFSFVLFTQCNRKEKQIEPGEQQTQTWISDSERFAMDYPLIGSNNLFVYRTAEQTAQILERGTGVVFIGFKECSWCQLYVVFLHDVALEMKMQRIFYCDIREDRLNNTESYQKIVRILFGENSMGSHSTEDIPLLQFDDEGQPRVYVPDVTIVNDGLIIARDFETSKDTLGYNTAEEYWNEDRVTALKNRLREGMGLVVSKSCNSC